MIMIEKSSTKHSTIQDIKQQALGLLQRKTETETFKNLEESADLGEYMKVKSLKVCQMEKEDFMVILIAQNPIKFSKVK